MRCKCLPIIRSIALLIAATVLVTGCDEEKPLALVAFIDASASSQRYMPAYERLLLQQTQRLFTADSLSVFRVSQQVTRVYYGPPISKSLRSTFKTYFQVEPNERGTAMGTAFTQALIEARQAEEQGYRPILLFLGDLADEQVSGQGNLDLKTLPTLAQQLPPECYLICAFSEPRYTERVRLVLQPTLKKRLILINPEVASSPAGLRQIREALRR